MIPLAVPNLAGREAEYLEECVRSTFVSSVGEFVTRFEADIAAASGADRAEAVSSGTAALHLALRAVGVGQDDLVALPSYTFIASANAISYCGASPWLFDITPSSWTLDVEQLETTLRARLVPGPDGAIERSTGRRLGAILPVHTLGHPADLERIALVAATYGVPVVADAAAALGATYRGTAVGSIGAVASTFSFNGNKTITCGGGGAVVSDDAHLVERIHHLATTARRGPGYDHDEVGHNYRMTNLQAAVGCAQLEQLDGFLRRKREIHDAYASALAGLPGLAPFPEEPWARSARWFSGLVTDTAEPDWVEELRRALREAGVDARPFWKPMHLQAPYANAPREDLVVSDSLWQRVLPLPSSTGITDGEIETVIAAVRGALLR